MKDNARPQFGVERAITRADLEGAWLVVVIRPAPELPEPTARHIDTYKLPGGRLPEDPELIPKLAADLRELADDLERRGWANAFRPE